MLTTSTGPTEAASDEPDRSDRSARPGGLARRRPRRRLVLLLALALLTVAGVGAWLLTRGDGAAETTTSTATVATTTMRETVAASGTVQPRQTAELAFEVSGTVTGVYVAEGDTVTNGQLLARVDATALVAARTAARSSYDAAVAQLEEDEDAGASDVQLAADQTAVVSAEAALEQARQDVEDAELRATVNGTVTSLDLAVGDVVGSSGSSGTSGSTGGSSDTSTDSASTAAVTIVSTHRYLVDATVASTDVERLTEGLQAEITVTGVTDTVYGTVQSVGLVAETNSSGAAVFPVTIEVTGTPEGLYAGTSAEVTIIVKQIPDVLAVDSRALRADGDTTYVEKMVDGGIVRTEVETGAVYGMQTEIVSGLAEGDVVEVPGFTRPTGSGDGGVVQLEVPAGGQLPGRTGPGDTFMVPGGGQ